MTDHYTPQQLEEVSSWIHNEQRCVTTQTISLAMGLPRSVAAMMLIEMPKKDGESYECTKCVLTTKDDGTTVIQLRKSVVSANDMDVDDTTTASSSIYSLALVETESVHTAHEKDMAKFRDLLKEEDNAAPTLALDGSLHQHDIASCFSTGRVTARASQEQRLAGRVAAATAQHAAAPAAPATKKAARKATTAANFFAASTSKKKAATTSKATAKPAAAKKKSTTTTKTAPAAKAQKKSDANKMDIDEEEHSDASTVEFSQEEKENSVNKKIGNADDFVGDEDEDEEFEEEERKRAQRQKTAAKKKRAKKPAVEVVEKEPVHGAMDAFAQPQEKPAAPPKHHKRRKKLVDKTTMDANGYLHTETQAVWEDVSSGEEDEKPAPMPKKKAPVKSTKNMKQGSLMGFFKKK